MTTPEETIERLRRELEAAFANRADLYRLLFDELSVRLGEAEAEVVLTRVIEKRGAEVAPLLSDIAPHHARQIGEAFLAVSPDGGRMYPVEVGYLDDGISFRVLRCPLKDAWRAAAVSEDRLEALCRIAGAFDRGLFEATGVCFANRTWRIGDPDGCCEITLTAPPAPDKL